MSRVKELREKAKDMGVKGWWKMKKQDLLNAINEKQEEGITQFYTINLWGREGQLVFPREAKNLMEVMREVPKWKSIHKPNYTFYKITLDNNVLRQGHL
jgi:hypothetical protein